MIEPRLRPEEMYEFVHLNEFDRAFNELNLTDYDLFELQNSIMEYPTRAPVIPGTGGIRKMRFAPSSVLHGKRGGFRVCFLIIEESHIVVLILIYPKTEKDDLNPEEKKTLKELSGRFRVAYAKKHRR